MFVDIPNAGLQNFVGTAGARSGFSENFSVAFDDQSRNNSLYGMEASIEAKWAANAANVARVTGEEQKSYPLGVFTSAARHAETGNPAGFWQQTMDGSASPDHQRMWDDFVATEQKLEKLKETNPDVRTFADIWAEVKSEAQALEKRSNDISERSGLAGAIGGFAGRAAGSFTWSDPVNLGTLGIGGAGRHIATRILTEAGAGAAVEAIDQFGGVQSSRKLMGLEERSPWESIAAAGVGAGVLRGGLEGVVPAYRGLEAKINPNRAAARIISDEIERNVGQPIGSLFSKSGLSDKQILDFMKKQPQTSENRAAIHALETEMDTIANNPFGKGLAAEQLHAQRLQEVWDMLDGRADRGQLSSSTALARVLDTPGGSQTVLPYGPIGDVQAAAVERMARDLSPDVFKRLDEAHAKLNDIRASADQINQALESRRVSDAVAAFDEPTSARMRAIEDELDAPIPSARRQELERELDMLTENLPTEKLLRAEEQFQLATKSEFRQEAGRKAAEREVKAAQKQADLAVQQAAKRLDAQQKLAAYNVGKRGEMSAADKAAKAELDAQLDEVFGKYLDDPNAIIRQAEDLKAKEDAAELEDNAMLERAMADAIREVEQGSTRMIDIGGKNPVPEDMHIPIDDAGNTMTVKQILADLAEDEKLIQQMKVCAL
jgi:hypothetical protein